MNFFDHETIFEHLALQKIMCNPVQIRSYYVVGTDIIYNVLVRGLILELYI